MMDKPWVESLHLSNYKDRAYHKILIIFSVQMQPVNWDNFYPRSFPGRPVLSDGHRNITGELPECQMNKNKYQSISTVVIHW